MAELARPDELVRLLDRDESFRREVEAAPTATAKRAVLDSRGFRDVGLEDMRAYVESKGAKLVVPETGRELTDQELAAVAGGITDEEVQQIGVGIAAASAAAV